MKRIKEFPKLETRTAVLLTGLAIGLAIAVHDIFFVVAALIALGGDGRLGRALDLRARDS